MSKTAVFLIASVLLIVGGPASGSSDGARQPNIIFIFADDWGYGDLGIHGSTFVETPNIDAMASEGIDFGNFTVNSPVCSPSRTAVMTGQFPARNSIHQHFAGIGANATRGMPDWLDPTIPLLPKLLRAAGYATGHFGKWHLGKAQDSPSEGEYGYDDFATFNGSGESVIEVSSLAGIHHTMDFIRSHKDRPFFVNLWLHETHLAHFPLEKYLEQFNALEERERVYAAVVAEADEVVGKILDLLKELNIDENTLVIFSSDNGPEFAKDESARYHKGNKKALGGYFSVGETGGLKGEKRSLYAGGIRVPFIARWPGVVPAGRIDNSSVMTAVDLLPTFLQVAGAPLPDGFIPDGESALSALQGRDFVRSKPIFWEWRGPKVREFTWPHRGIRDGRWKMISNDELKRTELYDLDGDWAEAVDVASEHPDVIRALSAKLAAWADTLPAAPEESTVSKHRK